MLVSHDIDLLNSHKNIEIKILISIDFNILGSYAVETKITPSLLSVDLMEILFFDGIDKGVTDAIHEANYILEEAETKVDVKDLSLSQPFDTFNENELLQIRDELRIIAREVLLQAISERNTRQPIHPG